MLRELPEDYYPVIGRIIVEWAFVETTLQDCIYMLLKITRREGRIAVRSPRPADVVTMIEELLEHHSFKTRVITKELKKHLTTVRTARDTVAHGVWLDSPLADIPVLQVRVGSHNIDPGGPATKARLDPVAMLAPPEQLEMTVKDIRAAAEAVLALYADIAQQAGPLPEEPLEL